MSEYCPFCKQQIPINDPDRLVYGPVVVHQRCYRLEVLKKNQQRSPWKRSN